jgi:pyruvate dehydrogenase E1 component alpha subunit
MVQNSVFTPDLGEGMSSEIIQIIDENGKVPANYKTDLNEENLKELHKTMVLTRVYDERSLMLQRAGRIGFYIGCKGQEASHVGSAFALTTEDWVFPAYREPGILLLRGIPLQSLICQMIGNEADVGSGRQMPCHYTYREGNNGSISSPLATQIPHAVGAAFAAKYKKDKIVTITYFGDGATSEGDFHVGMNFAAVFKTPTIFICQNNHWAISVPFHKQTASESIAIKAKAYGMPGIKVDGNDVLAMYEVTKEAAQRARNGDGPTLIESYTYRMGAHSSSDNDKLYRPQEELDEWLKKDPIVRFEGYLKREKILTAEQAAAVRKKAEEEFNQAVKEAEKFGPPKIETLFSDVYEDIPPILREQMNNLIEEQKRLGESADSSQAFPL